MATRGTAFPTSIIRMAFSYPAKLVSTTPDLVQAANMASKMDGKFLLFVAAVIAFFVVIRLISSPDQSYHDDDDGCGVVICR